MGEAKRPRPKWLPKNPYPPVIVIEHELEVSHPEHLAWEKCLDAVVKSLEENHMAVYRSKF